MKNLFFNKRIGDAAPMKTLKQKIEACNKCTLSETRTNPVLGEGNPKADIMFIGEAPGKKEDEQGRPFVGSAGKFLTELIESICLKREDVFITNVVKCRPPENRDPLPKEKEVCLPWLEEQIKSIKPKIIIPLGRHSMTTFLPETVISRDHGKLFPKEWGNTGKILFFPCYHPAAALYNGSLRETLFEDFRKIPKILANIEKNK